MGFLGDLGKELGKAALQGVANGIERRQREQQEQERQEFMREFIAHEREIQSEGEKGDLDAIQILTSVYYRQGDYQQAAYWGRKGVSFDDATCLYMMGEISYAQDDYRAAANFFERNVNVNGDTLSATALGNMLLQAEESNQAAYYFDFALRRDNSNGEAALGLTSCLLDEENPDLNKIEQLLQIAARSDNQGTRDAARQLLQQIREVQAENARQQQNSGCFVTTAVCDSFGKPDDCEELTTFRKFRDCWLMNQPDGKNLIAEYYSIAPRIVDKINCLPNAAQIYKSIWEKYLEPCLRFIKSNDNLSCKNKYVEMIRELKKAYV